MARRTVEDLHRVYEASVAGAVYDLKTWVAGFAESPIEELMIWALLARSDGFYTAVNWPLPALPGEAISEYAALGIVHHSWQAEWLRDFRLQPRIRVGTSSYRLDIAMEQYSRMYPRARVCLAIECDGHDFHEKTKEQAERDKRRDRDLQSLGWIVARFTGSEIVRDPERAAQQACELANGLLRQRELAQEAIAKARVAAHTEVMG